MLFSRIVSNEWDAPIDSDSSHEWNDSISEWSNLQRIKIDRFISDTSTLHCSKIEPVVINFLWQFLIVIGLIVWLRLYFCRHQRWTFITEFQTLYLAATSALCWLLKANAIEFESLNFWPDLKFLRSNDYRRVLKKVTNIIITHYISQCLCNYWY